MRYARKRWYSWSANIAYCVGLIASDGCLQKDGRHLDLTSVDIEQLENFCTAIGRNINITSKFTTHGAPAFRVQFSDVVFYDFLRGVLDGDGCVRGYMDKRWANSLMFYTEFASASKVFLEFLQATNKRLSGISLGTIKPGQRAHSLSYAKTDSIKLAAAMYYNDTIPSLTWKRTKLFSFIKQHENAIIARNARVVKLVNTSA